MATLKNSTRLKREYIRRCLAIDLRSALKAGQIEPVDSYWFRLGWRNTRNGVEVPDSMIPDKGGELDAYVCGQIYWKDRMVFLYGSTTE